MSNTIQNQFNFDNNNSFICLFSFVDGGKVSVDCVTQLTPIPIPIALKNNVGTKTTIPPRKFIPFEPTPFVKNTLKNWRYGFIGCSFVE